MWPTRPILSLIKEWQAEGSLGDTQKTLHSDEGQPNITENDPARTPAVWHGPDRATFSDTEVDNKLGILIRFKAKDPYAGCAQYRILIDKLVGEEWERQVLATVTEYTPARDHDNWWYWDREYMLDQHLGQYWRIPSPDVVVKFKITAHVLVGGHLPGSTSPGSSGVMSEPHSKEFTAIFKPPKRTLVKTRLTEIDLRSKHYYKEYIKSL